MGRFERIALMHNGWTVYLGVSQTEARNAVEKYCKIHHVDIRDIHLDYSKEDLVVSISRKALDKIVKEMGYDFSMCRYSYF